MTKFLLLCALIFNVAYGQHGEMEDLNHKDSGSALAKIEADKGKFR